MIEEELKKIWRASTSAERIKLDINHLVVELKNNMEYIDRKIANRDRRETIACYVGMVGFGFLAFYIPFFWSKIACILTILWFAYVIYRLKSVKRNHQPDLSLPLVEQLEQRKNYLRAQQQLIGSVFYWYVLPPFLINVLFLAGIEDPDSWDSILSTALPEMAGEKLLCLAVVAVFYAYITWMNRRAARTVYPPLIESVEALQRELNKG